MKRQLFSATSEPSPTDCAQCGKRMIFGIIYRVEIVDETFKVCSQKCEKELKDAKVAQNPLELGKAYGAALGNSYRGVGAILLPGYIVIAHDLDALREVWGKIFSAPLNEDMVMPWRYLHRRIVRGIHDEIVNRYRSTLDRFASRCRQGLGRVQVGIHRRAHGVLCRWCLH